MPTSVLPYITGGGGALVVLALVLYGAYIGKIHFDGEFRAVAVERDQYRDALEIERKASNELASTAGVTNQLIGALTQLATSRRDGAGREDMAS